MDVTKFLCCFVAYLCLKVSYSLPLASSKKAKVSKIHHKMYQEAEYDITLDKIPDQIRYFVKPEEFQEYQNKFEQIKDLGEEINCKLHGENCLGKKRAEIIQKQEKNVLGTKKSMFDNMGGGVDPSRGLMSPLSPQLEHDALQKFGPDDRYTQQHYAAQYGQQPQMDIKMPSFLAGTNDPPSMPGFGKEQNGMLDPASAQSSMDISPSSTFLRMQHEQNDATIQNSIQSKMAFMDQANNGKDQGMMGQPNHQMNAFSKLGSRDENPEDSIGGGITGNGPHGYPNNGEGSSVSENDILKAEGIQPNEMSDLHNFLKSSNEVNTHGAGSNDAEMTDGKFLNNDNMNDNGPDMSSEMHSETGPGRGEQSGFNNHPPFGKTNIDFGSDPRVENNEAGSFGRHNLELPQIKPGGPEVPVLNNLIGGPDPSMVDAPPSLKFVEDNTNEMIQSNSDYKLPQTAFSNIWRDYMSSTQSQLGQLDPSANSRETISTNAKAKKKNDVAKRRWKKSDVGQQKKQLKSTATHKADIPQKPKSFMYIPLFVVRNLLIQASKKSNLKPTTEKLMSVSPNSKSEVNAKPKEKTSKVSPKPALYITERNGKRYLVVNPAESESLIKGFAHVDSNYMSFAIPEKTYSSINGMPALDVSHNFQQEQNGFGGTHAGPFGGRPVLNGGNTGFPLISGHIDNAGNFQGYMAVPIITHLGTTNPSNYFSTYRGNHNNLNTGYQNSYTGFDTGFRDSYPTFNIGYPQGHNGFYGQSNGFGRLFDNVRDNLGGHYNGLSSRYNEEESSARDDDHSYYYPPRGLFQDGYANDPFFNFPKPFLHEPKNFQNTFMYGPAFYGNLDSHREDFERISMNQPIVTGHFYHDPNYDPRNADEQYIPAHSRHSFSDVDRTEIMKEVHMSGEDKLDPSLFSNVERDTQVEDAGNNADHGQETDLHEQSSEQVPLEIESENQGRAPEPDDMQETKRDNGEWTDHIFTKEHVGFGPITVEAKTAGSQMKDTDDD